MLKEEFITHLKKFLPSNYRIVIQNKNNYLVLVKSRFFNSEVTIHPVFLKADKNLIIDIVHFILNRSSNETKIIKKKLSDFFNANYEPKKTKINIKHKHRDIFTMYINVIKELTLKFPKIDFSQLKISWGRLTKNRSRSIRFGSFDKRHLLIRLHPILDKENIPDFFIYSIIYHEVAHFIKFRLNETDRSHGALFNKLLKNIDPFYKQSKKWEKENKRMFF